MPEAPSPPDPAARVRVPLRAVAGVFLRLGATSFGGPAAHIALMGDDCVRRRGWLTEADFPDLVGATNLIPGPNSTEVAIHVGHRVAGWPGLIVAGVCFILPAALIVGALAWAYVVHGHLPPAAGVLYGVKPVVVAVVAEVLWRLGRSAIRTPAGSGRGRRPRTGRAVRRRTGGAAPPGAGPPPARRRPRLARLLATPAPPAAGVAAGAAPFGLWPLFWLLVKIGSVLFGSRSVLLAFLRADLVERRGWLSEQQLLDAVAVGQVTPGPVFTAATFIGYLLGGPGGRSSPQSASSSRRSCSSP